MSLFPFPLLVSVSRWTPRGERRTRCIVLSSEMKGLAGEMQVGRSQTDDEAWIAGEHGEQWGGLVDSC
jgi:hypothetical protein